MFDQCPIFSAIAEPFFYQATRNNNSTGTSESIDIPAGLGTGFGAATLSDENYFAMHSWRAKTNYDNVGGIAKGTTAAAALQLATTPNAFKCLITREQSNALMSSPMTQAALCSSGALAGKQFSVPIIYRPTETFNFTFNDLTNFFLTATNQSTAIALAIKFFMCGYHIRQSLWEEFLCFYPQLGNAYGAGNYQPQPSANLVPFPSNLIDEFSAEFDVSIASNVVGANTAAAQFKTQPDSWFVLTDIRASTNYDNLGEQFTTASTAAAMRTQLVSPSNFEVVIKRGGTRYNLMSNPVPQSVIAGSGYRNGNQFPWPCMYAPSTQFSLNFFNTAPSILQTAAAANIDLTINFALHGYYVKVANLGAFMSAWPNTLQSPLTQDAIRNGTLTA